MTDAQPQLRREKTAIPEVRFLFRSNVLRLLEKARKLSDDVVHVKFGRSDYFLMIDPELIEETLVSKQSFFGKQKYISFSLSAQKAVTRRLVASVVPFESHDQQRKRQQAAFHQERITAYGNMMTDITERYCSSWRDGQVIDIGHEMVKLTTLFVAKCLFNMDIESRAEEIASDLTTFAGYYERMSNPLADLLVKLPSNRKYETALHKVDALILNLVNDRKKATQDPGDMLSMLLKATNEQGKEMSFEQLRDQVGIFLVVGHETSTNCLTWTWHLLSQNPAVEQKMHQEIDSLFPNYEIPSASDVSKLDYTTKIISESLRLYPPSWCLIRETMKECTVGGYRFRAGSHIWISQYLNHRDPRYFPEPEKFLPDRWTEEMKKNIPRFSYFPFGGGARRCMGEPFAWMEISLLLAMISRRWRLLPIEGQKVVPHAAITLVPKHGIKMRLEKRS